MTPRDRKLAIFRQLSQETKALSLSELFDRMQFTQTSRTMRRWLQELIKEGLVEKSGQTKNVKYIALKPEALAGSCFGSKSLVALEKVKRPLYEREPVAYNDRWFDAYQPGESFYLPDSIRTQLKKEGQRSELHDPAGTYAHQIFNRLLIDLSYNSSRLEGNTYSLLDIERLLLHGKAPQGKLDEEKVMILNHREAIRYLVDNAARITVNEETIFTMHYLLADGFVKPQYAGKVRDHAVRVGGSTYMPFEDPKRLRIQMSRIAEKASRIQDPFEQSFFLLTHVSYLQAFADVNKRTARLCANIPLIPRNFVPLSFNDIDVGDYKAAIIAIYEFQDVQPLTDLFAYSYLRTCGSYDITVKTIGFDEVRVRYRRQRREVLREIILRQLVGGALELFIEEAKHLVALPDRQEFVVDLREDIAQMDVSRLAGLGVTEDQLKEWMFLMSDYK